MKPPMSDVTEDGYDIQFGTMVLGHFYFNKLLLPVLMATSEKEGRPSRIIVTSSIAARLITQQPAIAFDALKDGPVRRKGSTITYYLQAKLGNLVYAKEMAKRYGNKGVITIPLEPGA
jgi:retinol dehydrogenase-12